MIALNIFLCLFIINLLYNQLIWHYLKWLSVIWPNYDCQMHADKWKLLKKFNVRFAPAATWLLFVENHVKWRSEKMSLQQATESLLAGFSLQLRTWFSVECNEKWIFWLSALARPKHHADVVKHDVMVLLFGVLEVKTYLGL